MYWSQGHKLQNGKLTIETVLGHGGFGITYKAIHQGFQTPMTIKTPNAFLRNDPDYDKYVKRFIREARILAKLCRDPHPNIVRVHDLFEEEGAHCLVMEFIEGMNLYELVRKRGAIPEREALQYICPIAEALVKVHEAGLVHRDATSANIMLRGNSQPILIDFGISGEIIPTTVSSKMFGNRAFAPYEQITKGNRAPTVDIYTLAASLYHLVTGQLPVDCLARKVDDEELIPPKDLVAVSDRVNEAVVRGMAVQPSDRPQSMQEWLEVLNQKINVFPLVHSFPINSTQKIIRDKFCPACGSNNPVDSLFCQLCNYDLSESFLLTSPNSQQEIIEGIICPACGYDNLDNATICEACGHSFSSPPSSFTNLPNLLHLAPNTLLRQHTYKIEKVLGEGGFSITYKGINLDNLQEVAIKELFPDRSSRQGKQIIWSNSISFEDRTNSIDQFKMETRYIAECLHPNIVRVFDCFEENHTIYIVYEFIQDFTLQDILHRQKRIDEVFIKKYSLQILEALKTIHKNNILHRDIKPANIMINNRDKPILIDFGLARKFQLGMETTMDRILTPQYAPLEQYLSRGIFAPSLDIYSLCASMYELITGELPVEATDRVTVDTLMPPSQIVPSISSQMESLILKGMRIKVDERFQTADEMIAVLKDI